MNEMEEAEEAVRNKEKTEGQEEKKEKQEEKEEQEEQEGSGRRGGPRNLLNIQQAAAETQPSGISLMVVVHIEFFPQLRLPNIYPVFLIVVANVRYSNFISCSLKSSSCVC